MYSGVRLEGKRRSLA